MPINIVRLLHWANVSLIELDPSHISIQSCINAIGNTSPKRRDCNLHKPAVTQS